MLERLPGKFLKLKKSNLILKVKQLKKLKSNLLSKIFQLKKTHYKFSFSSQKIWFNKNIQATDKHLILFYKKEVIGYNVLRSKKINFIYLKTRASTNAYIFDTIIIKNKFRNLGLSKIIMNKSNNIIKKKKYISFLVCKEKMIEFYKSFNWKIIPDNKILITNFKKANKHVWMYYGKKLNIKKIKKIEIF